MSIFDLLAENQIQDYNRRKAEGKIDENAAPPAKRTSFESQLYSAIVTYYEQMAKLPEESIQRIKIERMAENLRLQLMVTLERNDMRLTGQFLDNALTDKRKELKV